MNSVCVRGKQTSTLINSRIRGVRRQPAGRAPLIIQTHNGQLPRTELPSSEAVTGTTRSAGRIPCVWFRRLSWFSCPRGRSPAPDLHGPPALNRSRENATTGGARQSSRRSAPRSSSRTIRSRRLGGFSACRVHVVCWWPSAFAVPGHRNRHGGARFIGGSPRRLRRPTAPVRVSPSWRRRS